MAGVRIRHATEHNVQAVIEDTTRPLKPPYQPCGECLRRTLQLRTHTVKTYHLDLDSDGARIVSQEVFDHLNRLGLSEHGFTKENDVKAAPAQTIRQELLVGVRISGQEPSKVKRDV